MATAQSNPLDGIVDVLVLCPETHLALDHTTLPQGYARVLRLVGLEHEDLVTMDDPDGKARVDEGKSLVERGKRHAQQAARRQVGARYK